MPLGRMEAIMDYKNAGVDIEAGYKAVELMKEHIASTMRSEVLTDIGGFSGAFSMEAFKNMEQPTLVSGTDGVGTKLKVAFEMDKHDTVGIDCVAMCVNDIACAGGEPLFFLDYIACGKNEPEKIAAIVSGVANGCKQSNAALIGGETAEMPGFYPIDEYLATYNHEDDNSQWFDKLKAVADKLGFASDMKAFKAEPEKFKGNVSDIAEVVRIAVTGLANTPDLWSIVHIMGEEQMRDRINAAKK